MHALQTRCGAHDPFLPRLLLSKIANAAIKWCQKRTRKRTKIAEFWGKMTLGASKRPPLEPPIFHPFKRFGSRI